MKALETEKANSDSLQKSYTSAEREIATLNRALDRYAAAVATFEKAVALIEKQRDEAKAEAKSAKRENRILKIVGVGAALAKIFLF